MQHTIFQDHLAFHDYFYGLLCTINQHGESDVNDFAKIVESTHQDQGFGGILSGVHADYVVCDIDLEHNFDENPLADHCKCD